MRKDTYSSKVLVVELITIKAKMIDDKNALRLLYLVVQKKVCLVTKFSINFASCSIYSLMN